MVRAISAAVVVASAGLAMAAEPPIAPAAKGRIRPPVLSISQISTGHVHVPRGGVEGGAVRVGYSNLYNPQSVNGLNVAFAEAGAYTGSGSDEAYLYPMTSCANTAGTEPPECDFMAPINPETGEPLELVFDEYFGSREAEPAGGFVGEESANVLDLGVVPFISNPQSASDRVNTLRILFFDPDDGEFLDGLLVSYLTPPGFFGYFEEHYDLSTSTFQVIVPAAVLVGVDWDNFEGNQSPNSTTGDEGLGMMIAGGDLTHPAYPRPETLWQVGSSDPATWINPDPSLMDPCADGNCSSSTFADVLLSSNNINWSFRRTTSGGVSELAHDLPFRIVVESGADACDADVAQPGGACGHGGDGQVNTDDFICYLSLFGAGDPLADMDRTAGVNTSDFIAFLGAFGAGCP